MKISDGTFSLCDISLYGDTALSLKVNKNIFESVQKFILHTKRF